MVNDISSDLALISQWGNNRLVTVNDWKNIPVTIHHWRSDPELPAVKMNGSSLCEAPFPWRLLKKRNRNFKWYGRRCRENCRPPVPQRKYLTPRAMRSHYKSQIKPKLESCCQIWAGEVQSSFSSLFSLHKSHRVFVGDKLFSTIPHPRNVSSPSVFYIPASMEST